MLRRRDPQEGDVGQAVRTVLLLCVLCLALPARADERPAGAGFLVAMELAGKALAAEDYEEARLQIQRALERDAKSPAAWALRARWGEAVGDLDEQIYALHRQLGLLVAQQAPRKDIRALRKRLESLDPIASRYLDLSKVFLERLVDLAEAYEKAKRPHSAIRVYQQVLALDPERDEAQRAIERISAAPDPSLAETAKPKDLFADVSDAWIREHDARHGTWDERAELERENYRTYTDAGYEVLVRCAEAMEQMNAFYRQFFDYGYDDGKSVPRIDLNIFRDRDTYLERGIGPPVDWSKGHFTGGAVETYIGNSGFESMTQVLFHEAAHQFVSLATNAAGWLNEGLASFFEGCRIQANGTVLMNMPANHRLFELARRMSNGWMEDAADGIDPNDPSSSNPPRAPTFRIVLENEYAWGPPWYAPTWGVVYFLYNVQDPLDGRFIYRAAFREFIDTSGGRIGEGAIENFEEVVLGNPQPRTKGLPDEGEVALPRTVDELDAVWKAWILRLRDEQNGSLEVERPYLEWARHAITRKDWDDASEHFEKGLLETPHDADLLVAFAEHLAGRFKNKDRATKLLLQAIRVLEAGAEVDEDRIGDLERRLEKLDPKQRSLGRLHRSLLKAASNIAEKYLAAEQYLMAMHVSWRLGTELQMPEMLSYFEDAVRRSGKSLSLWQLAYNEVDLAGWSTNGGTVFEPYGAILRSRFGTYEEGRYDYSFLTLDTVTSGDFSMEAEVLANEGENAFCGLVFGRKSGQAFHSLIFFPEGFVDLVSFYGPGVYKTWRHNGVPVEKDAWRTLRVDVSGSLVDVWHDGELVVSQTFPNRDVLRGSFGLITGPGRAQFRNVRYLARPAGDPAGPIERRLRLEALARAGRLNTGSFLGEVPPWPEVAAWIQEPRESWAEHGFVPTVLVFWGMNQNDLIPLHAWLSYVSARYAEAGLRVVSVCENTEVDALRAYLETHPFPGSVAVDALDTSRASYGETLDAYFVGKRHSLPRVLLLDIDQKTIWEGNPGFDMGKPWVEGMPSYLDTPLADLVTRRNLTRLAPWREAWAATGREALRRGDLEAALPLVLESLELPGDVVPEVAMAQTFLQDVQNAVDAIELTAAAIAREGSEPALPVLLAWAERLEIE
ncbi:MAG: hypothetical protein ACYTG6_05370, partial [Planctomycetota bacterium]